MESKAKDEFFLCYTAGNDLLTSRLPIILAAVYFGGRAGAPVMGCADVLQRCSDCLQWRC